MWPTFTTSLIAQIYTMAQSRETRSSSSKEKDDGNLIAQLLMEMQQQRREDQERMERLEDQRRQDQQRLELRHQEQLEALHLHIAKLGTGGEEQDKKVTPVVIPSFTAFDTSSELWADYWSRFLTFTSVHSVPEEKQAQLFLTSQTSSTYKLLSNLAEQQTPKISVNGLTLDQIHDYMEEQFHPAHYIVRERYKFWTTIKRKPGETPLELAARIRQAASTCDFQSVKDPLDEAMRTLFVCSIANESVLRTLFSAKDDDLTFAKAIELAVKTEEASKIAKETIHETKSDAFVRKTVPQTSYANKKSKVFPQTDARSLRSLPQLPKDYVCRACGKNNHLYVDCKHRKSTCNYCGRLGHLQAACFSKKRKENTSRDQAKVDTVVISKCDQVVDSHERDILRLPIRLQDQTLNFEVDTGAGRNLLSREFWKSLGNPKLSATNTCLRDANGREIETLGEFIMPCRLSEDYTATMKPEEADLKFLVVKRPVNLLGRGGIVLLKVDITSIMLSRRTAARVFNSESVAFVNTEANLQSACKQLCDEFPELFKDELGCLKDFKLHVRFRDNTQPIFVKPRTVPFAMTDDLNQAYDAGVKRGVWEWTQFNDYGTPVVPIRKAIRPGQTKASLRVCGDYSVTVNPQLEVIRQPIPMPEDLFCRLGGGHCYSKVDLADAYNQIVLDDESQRKLALSTHRGVLLQKRLPFGISSAVGEFQGIMERLIGDLPGVVVYLDDILVSGKDAEDHLQNLRRLLQRLQDSGLRCRKEKCEFAQPSVDYLGHRLTQSGIVKGRKAEAMQKMPAPTSISELRAFLGGIQFYAKFLPDLSTITEPFHRLTKKGAVWNWSAEQETAFQSLKNLLCEEKVLAHFDPSLTIGISCDASEVGLGVVLFQRYSDGSERPLSYASKSLTDAQRRYSQIQKEALSIVYGLKKFHQFLFARPIIIVTDHKPLQTLFAPTKGTPALAANRLARWALQISQYDYQIEYRKTTDHGNADVLSRLPSGKDPLFDTKEDEDDTDTVCIIRLISDQLNPLRPGVLAKETTKDPVLAQVVRFTREGWPPKSMSSNTNSQDTEGEDGTHDYTLNDFRRLEVSLSTLDNCLFYGSRVVIPTTLQRQVLDLLHTGHFGIQRMKQLARSAVYWPRLDASIEDLARSCSACSQHQSQPPKHANHPWMLPEKPWSRLHVDHAVNFMGTNWLVVVDSYSKYMCIHPTSSVSTKSTVELLEQDFAHFGNPHTIVSDNATTFSSEEFKTWCASRGVTHLTGAPYWPSTNGAAERAVRTFKTGLKKSSLPPNRALQEFLQQYRRTPLSSGLSPGQLLCGRQIRTPIDALLPSPAHWAQGKQAAAATQSQSEEAIKEFPQRVEVNSTSYKYKVGATVYALYCGPRRSESPRWVPAVVIKVFGSRCCKVRIQPSGSIWRRHVAQLRPRYA